MEQVKFTDKEVTEMLRFMLNVNKGWDSDRPARRNITIMVNQMATAYHIQNVEVPDEGCV